MSVYQKFVRQLDDDELLVILEAAYQMYDDRSLFEMFSRIVDLKPEALHPTFEKVEMFLMTVL